ncbi:hypothetical protein [Cellulomonas sp. ICMP 17802]|uniref:hypothetical protein n=1 Tax=Cellulomonas sp. ICMP 17802 TaxID=3239199 RepID=UPI00351B447D
MTADPQPSVVNPPGQPRLDRRLLTHPTALRSLRDTLSGDGHDPVVRAVARAGTDDPAVALLDAWAVVADTVCFYNERIATEGYLRTATEHRWLRELARELGYELRPGTAAEVDLAFSVETAPGAPDPVVVEAGTPVQSVPGAGQLPQTFETSAELEARAAWNAIPGSLTVAQQLPYGTEQIWVRVGPVVPRAGDHVLVVGDECRAHPTDHAGGDAERWDFRVVVRVESTPDGHAGWWRLDLDRPIGYHRDRELVAVAGVEVHLLRDQAHLYGHNAPDPRLLAVDGQAPGGAEGAGDLMHWKDYDVPAPQDTSAFELAGEHPGVVPGSWTVLAQPGYVEAYRVVRVKNDGATRYAVPGPITRVAVDAADSLTQFTRPQATVFLPAARLDAGRRPAVGPVDSTTVELEPHAPLLPAGRRVLVTGTRAGSPAVVVATVLHPAVAGTESVVVELSASVDLERTGLHVLANVVPATHGETQHHQVLGSGDGRATFPSFALRRAPLTYLRDVVASDGAVPALEVRVDGVAWEAVDDLGQTGPRDRAYTVLRDEGGAVRVVFGDGVHGTRLPTGQENVVANYRVGTGADGGVRADQVSLLPRRPVGVRAVTNPVPSHDWAAEETLETARTNAPQRIRTLDRVVSVRDHEDAARAFPGIGPARADLVWDGRRERVLVSVLAAGGLVPGGTLVDDLVLRLSLQREEGSPFDVVVGLPRWFGVRVEVAHDPAYRRADVEAAVLLALGSTFGPGSRELASAVSRADALLAVRTVPGVLACTMPRLLAIPSVPDPPAVATVPPDQAPPPDVLAAQPGRIDGTSVLPAELLAFAPGAVVIGVMTP